MNAVGIIEVSGMVAAVEATDAMLKSADVTVITWEKGISRNYISFLSL